MLQSELYCVQFINGDLLPLNRLGIGNVVFHEGDVLKMDHLTHLTLGNIESWIADLDIALRFKKLIKLHIEDHISLCIIDRLLMRCAQPITLKFVSTWNAFASRLTREANLENVKTLILASNNITSIENLLFVNMGKVQYINLSLNCITNLKPFSKMLVERIINLNLGDNPFDVFSPLEELLEKNIGYVGYVVDFSGNR